MAGARLTIYQDIATFLVHSMDPSLSCQQLKSKGIRCGVAAIDHNLYQFMIAESAEEIPYRLVTVPPATVAPNAKPEAYNQKTRRFTFTPEVQLEFQNVLSDIWEKITHQINDTCDAKQHRVNARPILFGTRAIKSSYVQEQMRHFASIKGVDFYTVPRRIRSLVVQYAEPYWEPHYCFESQALWCGHERTTAVAFLPASLMLHRPTWFLRKEERFSALHQGVAWIRICHKPTDGHIVRIPIRESDSQGDPPAQVDNRRKRHLALLSCLIFSP
ncbi:uncharacterized protein ATNIH1004_008872 [Aspergillus tanneri]|uniref:Uncharacterized protein n=1 Tax=Aspergillus tanneri TaxID=1220188 RepID=A0A5M9MFY0_9EURO|nr:uncharacterized protein ATNIH1004_008872 [Aspergillus tanneri]KAA8644666.1 hypothetical protein ATNIH1004_008872 [Aspergillus tanneri]